MISEDLNTRVLIIDDEEMVRDNIEEILVPKKHYQNEMITSAASILFDELDDEPILSSPKNNPIPVFRVDKAINGMEGVEKVKQSVLNADPYAVIFLDMRMPGWDGLETALEIRKIDTKVEIIIVTAFSDKSIEDIVAKLGQNVGYHCKPYASEEIIQLATKAINDYNKLRNLENLIAAISNINISQNHLNSLLQNILDQLVTYVGSDVAVLGKLLPNGEYQKLHTIGSVDKEINLSKLQSIIQQAKQNDEEVVQMNDLVFVNLDSFCIFVALNKKQPLKTEKVYLLKLFVQNAAKAIKNVRLQEELLKKEKLSAVGGALSMLMHDVRGPVKNIPVITNYIRDEGLSSDMLDLIDASVSQVTEIIEDFLDFVRDNPINIQLVALNKVVAESIEQAKAKNAGKEVLIANFLENNLFVLGDASKLRRIFMNLICNAIEVLYDKRIANPRIEISNKVLEHQIKISIADNGPGIPEKIKDTLFDAFVTANKSNGTGLGLAIVKQFVEAIGGTITVTNNNGAIFNLTLPKA